MKFDFSKSSDADLQNKLQIISGNILYITHEVDKIHKLIVNIKTSVDLQKQVIDYFDSKEETSPQTDTVN